MQPMLWQMWGGELVPLGCVEPDRDYSWKMYYYCDFYLLYRQKLHAFKKMDYYVDAVDAANPKLMPREPYEAAIAALVKQPIKQVKIMQPGPWGAYRYRDLWDVPGLECNAWNELAGIELSILMDVGAGDLINMPAQNIMQHPVQMVGEKIHREFPGLLPLQVWLDDGYFPNRCPSNVRACPSMTTRTPIRAPAFQGAARALRDLLHRGGLPARDHLDGLQRGRRPGGMGAPLPRIRQDQEAHRQLAGVCQALGYQRRRPLPDPARHDARPRRQPDDPGDGYLPQRLRHRVFLLHLRLLPPDLG